MFHYRAISGELIDSVGSSFASGESVVLLGPRQGGKRHVMLRASERLRTGGRPVAVIWDPASPSIPDWDAFTLTLRKSLEDAGLSPGASAEPGDLIRAAAAGGRVHLVVSNVDSLPPGVARQFLRLVRVLVQERVLAVLISGEQDLTDLVHGPGSEFNLATQYFLQGMARDEFGKVFHSYAKAMGISFREPASECERLWRHTGGSAFFLRHLMFQAIEARVRTRDGDREDLLPRDLAPRTSLSDFTNHLRNAQRRVSGDPDCWPHLLELLRSDDGKAPAPESAPGTLEFAGLAFREGASLRIRSPLVREIAGAYWDNRRLADLHGLHGNWDEAMRRYSGLHPSQCSRPTDADDRVEIERLVSALGLALQSEVHRGEAHLTGTLAQGCRFLLGLQVAAFDLRPPAREWTGSLGLLGASGAPKDLASAIPTAIPMSQHPLLIDVTWADCARLVIVERAIGDYTAIVAGNLESKAPLSRERLRLTERLLDHYQKAHRQSVAGEKVRLRLLKRDLHIGIINAIIEPLGQNALDADQVLSSAGAGLRDLGYHRVLVCAVNPDRRRIAGVVDHSDNPVTASMTDWTLTDHEKDIQPWVVHHGRSKVVPDPSAEPLINKEVHNRAQLRPLAIVPMLNPRGYAVGTIHVERADGMVPSAAEVSDLELFGRQLAVLMEQCERVRLQQEVLARIPEPIILTDIAGSVRYINPEARKLFPYAACGTALGESIDPDLVPLLQGTLEHGKHRALHKAGFGDNRDYLGTIRFDPLKNRRDQRTGTLVHIQEFNHLERAFALISKMAQAHDTKSATAMLVETLQQLGPEWVRMYEVDPSHPTTLRGTKWTGKGDRRDIERFQAGEVYLTKDDAPSAFACLDGEPVLAFVFDPDATENFAETPQGIRAEVVREMRTGPVIRRTKGEFWIDLAVKTATRKIGKVTLQWSPDWPAELFEVLKLLAEHATALLTAFERRDRVIAEGRDYVLGSVVEQTMASIGHNLITRIAPLDSISEYFQAVRELDPVSKKMAGRFAEILKDTASTLERTKWALTPVQVKRELCDIGELAKKELQVRLPEDRWSVHVDGDPTVSLDSARFGEAFAEIGRNTQEIAAPESQVTVKVTRGPAGQVRIEYADDGPGVPLENKPRIFDAFFTSRQSGPRGDGLGLAYVKKVLTAHGGDIEETGTPGQGVRFVMTIPAGEAEMK